MAAKKKTKKKTKKKAAKSTSGKPNALEFARDYLKKKPEAEYAEIRDAAKKKRITLYPISYGRAQALEGIVKMSAYGTAKNKKKKKSKRGPGRPKGSKNKSTRGPGRPRKSPTAGTHSIEGLVATIKNLQQERDDALRAIEQIRALLDRI